MEDIICHVVVLLSFDVVDFESDIDTLLNLHLPTHTHNTNHRSNCRRKGRTIHLPHLRPSPIPLPRPLWPQRTMRPHNASPLLPQTPPIHENEMSLLPRLSDGQTIESSLLCQITPDRRGPSQGGNGARCRAGECRPHCRGGTHLGDQIERKGEHAPPIGQIGRCPPRYKNGTRSSH